MQAKSAGLPSPTSISTRMYAPYSSRSARAPSLRGMRAIASVCLEECEHSLSLERLSLERDRERGSEGRDRDSDRERDREREQDRHKERQCVCVSPHSTRTLLLLHARHVDTATWMACRIRLWQHQKCANTSRRQSQTATVS